MSSKELNLLTRSIIGCAIQVHKTLGPGLLESVYEGAMCLELEHHKIPYRNQVYLPIFYRRKRISAPLKIDLLVAETVIVELKAIDVLLPVHEAQLLSYLRLSGKDVGLLINFNVCVLKEGIRRKMRTFPIST